MGSVDINSYVNNSFVDYYIHFFPEQSLANAEKKIGENDLVSAKKLLEDLIVQVNPIPEQKIIEKAKYLLADLLYFRSAKEGTNAQRALELYDEISNSSKSEELVTKAKLALGIIYYNEESIDNDWDIAMCYFKEVNNNCLADTETRILANFHQAEMLRLGNESIPKNWQESAKLYREVITQLPAEKTFDAKFTLACMLTSNNYGLESCIKESISLLKDVIDKSKDVAVSNKAKYELAKIYIACALDLDDDLSKSTELLKQIIISSDRGSDLRAEAKLSLIEIFINKNNFNMARELINEITSDKDLKTKYILRAYQFKLHLLKPDNSSKDDFLITLFKIYLFSDAEGRASVEKELDNSIKNKFDLLFAIEAYYQAIDDLKHFTLEIPVWPNRFGTLENFFNEFSNTSDSKELEKMKAIILNLVKYDYPINDYIDPINPIHNSLAELFIVEANKLVPEFNRKKINVENAKLAIKLLNKVSKISLYYPKALYNKTLTMYYLILKETNSLILAYNSIIPNLNEAQRYGPQLEILQKKNAEWIALALDEQEFLGLKNKRQRNN